MSARGRFLQKTTNSYALPASAYFGVALTATGTPMGAPTSIGSVIDSISSKSSTSLKENPHLYTKGVAKSLANQSMIRSVSQATAQDMVEGVPVRGKVSSLMVHRAGEVVAQKEHSSSLQIKSVIAKPSSNSVLDVPAAPVIRDTDRDLPQQNLRARSLESLPASVQGDTIYHVIENDPPVPRRRSYADVARGHPRLADNIQTQTFTFGPLISYGLPAYKSTSGDRIDVIVRTERQPKPIVVIRTPGGLSSMASLGMSSLLPSETLLPSNTRASGIVMRAGVPYKFVIQKEGGRTETLLKPLRKI